MSVELYRSHGGDDGGMGGNHLGAGGGGVRGGDGRMDKDQISMKSDFGMDARRRFSMLYCRENKVQITCLSDLQLCMSDD